jgi:O-antigen ligase
MAAAFVAAVATTLVAGDRLARRVVAVFGAVSIVLASVLVLSHANGASTRQVTSDRSRLVDVTWTVIRHHPIVGVGVGGQPRASRDEAAESSTIPSRDRSHTTPLTVAAELGVLGAAAYVLFVAAAAKLLLTAARRRLELGVGLGAVFLVLLIHSFFYAGFFEDPLTWGSLAVAAAALAAGSRRPLLTDALKPLADPDDDGPRQRTEVAGVVESGEPQAVPPAR